MRKNMLKTISFFLWSPIVAPLNFLFVMHLQSTVPKSKIDGSVSFGGVTLSSLQSSQIAILILIAGGVLLQILLVYIYNKWGIFSGKRKIAKIIICVVMSSLLFTLATAVSLAISYSYTMLHFR